MRNLFMLLILCMLMSNLAILLAEEIIPISAGNGNIMKDDTILVEYDGGVITRKDLDAKISKIPPNQQGRYRTVAGQTQVMDIMAIEDVLMAKAIQLKIDSEPDVIKKIQSGLRQFYIQEYYERNVRQNVELTDQSKRAYYMTNPDLFVVLPVVNIQYIQVTDEAAGRQVLAELEAGANWETVSDVYNQNSYVKGLKGMIKSIRLNGNIPGVGNDPELEELIRLNIDSLNKIIGPVQTGTGWHIFKIAQYSPGRSKSYEEVLPELEQRLRPIKENELLQSVKDTLYKKYAVVMDSINIAKVDLNQPAKNQSILSEVLVSSNNSEIVFTVSSLMDAYNQLSPQEQIFYIKGEGAKQLIDQELIRTVMYVEARALGYEQYFEQKDDYQQMLRFYVLNTAFRRLVIDAIVVPDEEVNAYYNSHINEYKSPASRAIQILWFEDEKSAQRTWKSFSRLHKLGDEKRMTKLVEKESKNPTLSILDNQYDNGIITGIGPDADFSRMIWDNPVGYLSPVFSTARGDIVFFRTLRENVPTAKSLTEMQPRIYGILKKEKEASQQEKVVQELFDEFHVKKYPERLRLLLSADELFNMADDAARLRNFKDAINAYDQIIQNYQNGVDDYKAYFMKAFLVSEEVKNKDLALDLFKAFIQKFPSGDLNESAQFMIDTLEGKIVFDVEEDEEGSR